MAKKTQSDKTQASRLPPEAAKKPVAKPETEQAMSEAKKQPRTEYNVTPEQFITTWQTSETAQEVADKLGMPKAIVLARASSYRSDGIKLKKMKRDSKKALDVDALNRLIEKLNESTSKESTPKKSEDAVRKLMKEKDNK